MKARINPWCLYIEKKCTFVKISLDTEEKVITDHCPLAVSVQDTAYPKNTRPILSETILFTSFCLTTQDCPLAFV